MATTVGCDSLPVASSICHAVVDTASDPVGTVGGAASRAATDAVGKWLVTGVTGAGRHLIDGLDGLLTNSTTPNLGADWFLGNYNTVLGIALLVAAVTFMIQIVSSLIRREPGMLGRAVTGSAVGVIGGFVVLAICQVCLGATDELCAGLLRSSGSGSLGASMSTMWGTSMASMGPAQWLLAVLLGLLFVIGAVMLWVAMFLREISIYVLAVFAPIAFAGYGWDRTRSWLRRWGEIVAALVFSKLVIYIVFILGMAMVSQAGHAPGTGAAISQLLGGACLLFMAALSPWATHRFISFAGPAAQDAHEHGSPRGAVGAAAMTGVTTAMVVGRKVSTTAIGAATGGPAGAAAGAAQPAGGGRVVSQLEGAGAPASAPGGGSGDGGSSGPVPATAPQSADGPTPTSGPASAPDRAAGSAPSPAGPATGSNGSGAAAAAAGAPSGAASAAAV